MLANVGPASAASRPAKPMLQGLAFTRQPICEVSSLSTHGPAVVARPVELSGRIMWMP